MNTGDSGSPVAPQIAEPTPPKRTAPARASRSAPRKPAQSGDFTARTWAQALLQRLGAPVTPANVRAIVSWEAAEGGHWNNSAYYNPLNTTMPAAGATSMNGVGVKAYTSWLQGLDATVRTLHSGQYNGILNALRAGNDANAVANAVVSSPWGTQQIKVGNYSAYGTQQVNTSNRVVANGNLASSNPTHDVNTYFDQNVASQYGYLSAYLHDKELGPILKQAAAQGWGQNKLLSALEKTHWWQATSQTAREMQALQRTDPASYREQYQGKLAQVQSLATSLGIQINPARLKQLTTTALWSNWSPLQLQTAVGAEFHYNPNSAYTGTAGADIQTFKKHAAEYLVPLSDKTLASWVQQAVQGKINPDDFTGYLSEQAKTLFPWMSKAIDAGVTPTTYLEPYRQAAAQTLELDPNAVDFTNPKYMSLVQTVDPKTGQRTENGLANAMTMMRTDPRFGYDKTQGARDQAAAFAASIAHQFGYQGDSGSGMSGVSNPAA